MTPQEHPSVEDLKGIAVFADLEDAQLEWLAEHLHIERYRTGDLVTPAGTIADTMVVIFEGEMQGRREGAGTDAMLFILPAGRVSGKLPFSRMKQYPADVRAVGNTRIGRMPESDFPEMLHCIPHLGERLVGVLSDRIRESTKVDQNREKLAALGKLSAGLAHELNNPASAAHRSASNLREALDHLADANRRIATCPLSDDQRDRIAAFEKEAAAQLDTMPVLDSLAQSDREEELIDWLEKHKIANGWQTASALAESGMDRGSLDRLLEITGPAALGTVLHRIAATFAVERLLREIENSTDRISVLVRAIKDYSFMDRMKEQEIDIHRGLESTLTMMGHFLKGGIDVHREYDKSLPRIVANGGELNQIWTNLIDNAIGAMKGKGELTIRTAREGELVLVEIGDTGPGIPLAIQDRIFEPFFTTKGVGEGTGLGLDFVYRIVTRHHGDVRYISEPGKTVFQVRLPIHQPDTFAPSELEEVHSS